jgi:hypothetical protein
MQNCMAVWAHRAEVSDGIDPVLFANVRKLAHVVNMDKSLRNLAIPRLE